MRWSLLVAPALMIVLVGLPVSAASKPEDQMSIEAREQEAGQELVAEVRANPALFGGVYYDDGYVVLRMETSPPLTFDSVTKDVRLRYVEAEHSFAELDGLANQIAAIALRMDDVADSGFVDVGIDEPGNRVRLTVTNAKASFLNEDLPKAEALDLRTGEMAKPLVCNSQSDCLPTRGGIRIQYALNGGILICTLGANARRANGLIASVTAGHCDPWVTKLWIHPHTQGGSQAVGGSLKNGLLSNDWIDALSIYNTGLASNPYNRLYYAAGAKSRPIVARVGNAQLTVGLTVSKSGQTSGTTTGHITQGRHLIQMAPAVDGQTYLTWVWTADFYASGGDSGGTVWWTSAPGNPNGPAALSGFVSAGGSPCCITDFVSQEDALFTLGLSYWCLLDAC